MFLLVLVPLQKWDIVGSGADPKNPSFLCNIDFHSWSVLYHNTKARGDIAVLLSISVSLVTCRLSDFMGEWRGMCMELVSCGNADEY